MKDYYSPLGVDRTATKTDIKSSYRRLAVKYHPDKSSDPDSASRFIAVTEAYDVLSNKKRRAQYDLFVWEKLKRKKAAAQSFTVVTPPPESTRTRRNKAQQKRGITYHQAASQTTKMTKLLMESLYVVSRYVLHVLGITLLLVILSTEAGQLSASFEKGIIPGFLTSAFFIIVLAAISWIARHAFGEYKKDVEALSVFYRISQGKAAASILGGLVFALVLFVKILLSYF